jgi:hypothetical protein
VGKIIVFGTFLQDFMELGGNLVGVDLFSLWCANPIGN